VPRVPLSAFHASAVVALALNLFACAAAREPQRSADEVETRASALAPAVGPALQFDEPVRVQSDGPGIGIAAGASNHLFVWRTDSDVYGARVGFDGTLVDQLPFRLTPDARTQKVARLAFNGTDWLVAYSDDDGAGAVQVGATRVAADGTVRDPNGIAVTTGTGDHLLQDVASDGADFLVTWYAAGIQAAIVSSAGAAQPPFMVGSATPSGPAGVSADAFNGTEYLVAYSETVGANQYLRARRVSRAGALVGSRIELGTVPSVSLVDVASDGTSWLVSYVSDALRWQVVAADGTLGGTGSAAGTFGGLTTDPVSRLSSTGNGAGFTLATIQGTSLFLAHISAGGTLMTSASPAASGDVFEVAVARGGGSDFLTYTATTPVFSAPARGARLDSNLNLASARPILSFHANEQDLPHAAFNGTNYLVVWEDLRGSQSAAQSDLWLGPPAGTVYGRRVSPSGQLLGSSSFTIAPVGVPGLLPDVGSNGTDYLVVWRGGDVADGLYARRVTAAGAVVDTNAIPLDLTSGDKRFPSVGSNGTDYYVAWSVASKELRGARLLANGTMPSAPTTFATGVFGGVDNPAVAFNGTNYLVAWGEADDIMATRVSPATGALLDTTRIAVAANSSIGEYHPAAASNGTDWLVAWDSRLDIRAARVAADGTVKDPNGITIDTGSDLQIGVAVTWAGSYYWVTWSAPNNIIAAKRVAADGTVMDATAVPIASGANYIASGPLVDVAAAGGDRALFLYPLYELARNGTSRAYGRIVPSPTGTGGAGGSGGSTGSGGSAGGSTGAGGAAGRGGSGGNAGTGGTNATGGSTAGGSGAGGRGGSGGASAGSMAGGSGAGGRGGSGVAGGGAAGGSTATGGSAVAGAGAGGSAAKAGCGCYHAPGSSSPTAFAIILLGLCLRRRATGRR
jgi:hypothetical protein